MGTLAQGKFFSFFRSRAELVLVLNKSGSPVEAKALVFFFMLLKIEDNLFNKIIISKMELIKVPLLAMLIGSILNPQKHWLCIIELLRVSRKYKQFKQNQPSMYSDNFVLHMFQKANELLAIERNKRTRAHQKLDYNLKRMLDHLPPQLKLMKVEELVGEFNGDLDSAAEKLVKFDSPEEECMKVYQSPPKAQMKKRNIRKNNLHAVDG